MQVDSSPVVHESSSGEVLKQILHKSLWYSDGNIVLIAPLWGSEPQTPFVYFRVHKSILACQSKVFADMLSFPEPADGLMEMYDGLPVVRLPDLADKVIAPLLGVMYNQWYLPHKMWKATTPLEVQEVLAAAQKYEMENLCNRIISHILADWPCSLGSWDLAEARHSLLTECDDSDDPVDDLVPEPASAIVLARTCDIRDILPAAFYSLARIRTEDDYDMNHTFPDDMSYLTRTARWKLLSLDDIQHLNRGRDQLEILVRDLKFKWTRTPSCFPGNACAVAHKELVRQVKLEAYDSRDILAVLWKFSSPGVVVREFTCCVACGDELLVKMRDKRMNIWDNLRAYFKI
ncbi:hypothetical protein DFH11DRAFT_1509743 [Phellopilus nigrolimitatus]|nr:hypothetical protein DFH11DRAFT_1509743 [Phellopilus nigrolimitatus]